MFNGAFDTGTCGTTGPLNSLGSVLIPGYGYLSSIEPFGSNAEPRVPRREPRVRLYLEGTRSPSTIRPNLPPVTKPRESAAA
jgi:hypothetical protein